MKVVFMGTPDFAVPTLQELIKSKHEVVAVVTKEDKPKGRGHKIEYTPVKKVALDSNIKVLQPKKIKDDMFIDELKKLEADYFIVVAYGKILPKKVLDIPKYGCINVHGSLLPKYRGCAPIQWAIINGEKVTGVTTMYMDENMDTGDILLKSEIEIEEDDNAKTMHDKLSIIGSKLLIKTLDKIENREVIRIKQHDKEATYTKMITKKMGVISWHKTVDEIKCFIKGLSPWPSAYTYYKDKMMKIFKVEEDDGYYEGEIGEIVDVDKNSFVVKLQNGAIRIFEIQIQDSKRMSVEDFLKGHKLYIGDVLGL